MSPACRAELCHQDLPTARLEIGPQSAAWQAGLTTMQNHLPPDVKEVLILMNPKAGARDSRLRVERLADILTAKGLSAEIFTDLDAVAQKAKRLFASGNLRALVGVGGDGTAAELVNRTCPDLPLTMLPGGNENLLARYLHLAAEPEKMAETIVAGKILRLDAGRAGSRIFLLMAGCGLDAEVVRKVHGQRTGHIHSSDYIKPLWEVVRTYDYPELRVYCDMMPASEEGVRQDEKALHDLKPLSLRWLAVFNLPCYGGGLQIAPEAEGSDAQLDLCGFRGRSVSRFATLVAAIFFRRQRWLRDWLTRKIQRIRIESDTPVPYQLDGDPGGVLPLEIEVLPKRLTLIVP